MSPKQKSLLDEISVLKQRLAETEARFNALTETFPIAVGISTSDGTFLYINNAYHQIFGYSLEEINRIKASDLYIDPNDRQKWLEILRAEGSVNDYEVQLKRKDGTPFQAMISVLPIDLAGDQAYIGSVMDITNRKRIETELRQIEAQRQLAESIQADRQRFFDLLETLPVMICLLTSDYRLVFVNQAFRATFGEAEGRHCYEHWYERDKPCDFCETQNVLKTDQPRRWELTTQAGRVIEINDVPFTDVDGTHMILETSVDITDRRRSEQELLRYQEQLEQRVRDRTLSLETANVKLKTEIKERKLAEKSLRKNEVLLRSILDQMPSGVTIREAKSGNLILANKNAREIMGLLADSTQQFYYYRGRHPDGRVYSPEEWPVNRSIATGEVINGEEINYERSDGSHIILSINSAPVRDPQGNIIIGVGVFQDITERKQAQNRLTYLASFPERNPNPIVEVDLQHKINYVNPIAMSMFPDIMQRGTNHEWFAGLSKIYIQFLGGGPDIITRDVSIGRRYFRQSVHYTASEGLIRIYGLDITDQKQAEQALRLSEEKYRTIVETAAEGIILARPTGEYTYVNRQMAYMLGYQAAEMLGKTGLDYMYDPQQSQVLTLRNALHKGEVLHGEFKFRRQDGSVLWSMYNSSPVYNDQGEHIANLSMLTDVTERKLAEQALRQAHTELEQRVQERTQELYSANNQLRIEVQERQKAQSELESSLQELQVIEEELRNNNEMLLEAHKVLETERLRYQDLFEFAPDAYLVTDDKGKVIEANQNTTILLRISLKTLIGKPLNVFINQADHRVFNHILASLQKHETMPSQELRLIPRSGAEITSSVRVARAEGNGKVYTIRWTIRDVTARKRNEEIIRQNALRNAVLTEVFQLLAEASLDEKAIMDIVVKTIARLIGDGCVITRVSADGQGLVPAAWHHRSAEALDLMSAAYSTLDNSIATGPTGHVFQSSESLLIKEWLPGDAMKNIPPQYHHYLDSVGISSLLVVPILISGKTIGTLAISRDRHGQPYTEDDQSMLEILATRTAQSIHNARLYQELQDSLRKELETHDQLVQSEKFAAVGRLLASITHEINNPLQTIKNCLYLSQMDIQPGTPAHDALNIATAETNRLSNLVAQLREIYRPPTHGASKPVNLPTLVDEVQVLLGSYLQDKHIRWEVTAPTDERFSRLLVEGVPDQLKQVFLNICLNAIDAMEPQGGSLKIDYKVDPEASLVGVCFQDTGPGLPSEVKEKLYEPFITTKEKGLGLGLVICYDIIQKHHGNIELESVEGKGAAFTIWLPVKEKQHEKD